MRKFNLIAILLAAVMIITALPATDVSAYTYWQDISVKTVTSINDTVNPTTESFVGITGETTVAKFTVSYPMAIKAYMTWDNNVKTVNTWFSTDSDGLNVVGVKTTLKTSGSSVVRVLDPGTYYMCFDHVSAVKDVTFGIINVALIGEYVDTNETYYQSSMDYPNIIAAGNQYRGALSATSGTNYYLLGLSESSNVSFHFGFTQYGSNPVNKGTINVYDTNRTLIASQTFKATAGADNTLKKALEKGAYFVTLTGAEAGATLSYEATLNEESADGLARRLTPVTSSITYVESLDSIQYPTTDKFESVSGTIGVRKLKVTEPSLVKVYMTWDANIFTTANIWLSRDPEGLDIISDTETLKKPQTYIYHALDKGTYYINFSLNAKSSKKDAASAAVSGICFIGESVKTGEKYEVSSFKKANSVTLKKTKKGFLSVTTPIDYYKIKIPEKSKVTFTFNFVQYSDTDASKGTFKLYSKDKTLLKEQKFSTTKSENNKYSVLLKAGTYYVTLSGAEAATTLKVNASSREVTGTYTLSSDKKSATVNLSFSFTSNQTYCVKGFVYADSLTNNSIWSKSAKNLTVMTGKSIKVTSNGYYSFRVCDTDGNYHMTRIKVEGIK